MKKNTHIYPPLISKTVVLVDEYLRYKYTTIGLKEHQPYRVLQVGNEMVRLQHSTSTQLVDVRALKGSSHQFAIGDKVVLYDKRRGSAMLPHYIISYSPDGCYLLGNGKRVKSENLRLYKGELTPQNLIVKEKLQPTLF